MLLSQGKKVFRDDGKSIVEWVGAATTGTDAVSVARCKAPPGWREPAQTPAFDEVVMVLSGTLTLELEDSIERVRAGKVGLVPAASASPTPTPGGCPASTSASAPRRSAPGWRASRSRSPSGC